MINLADLNPQTRSESWRYSPLALWEKSLNEFSPVSVSAHIKSDSLGKSVIVHRYEDLPEERKIDIEKKVKILGQRDDGISQDLSVKLPLYLNRNFLVVEVTPTDTNSPILIEVAQSSADKSEAHNEQTSAPYLFFDFAPGSKASVLFEKTYQAPNWGLYDFFLEETAECEVLELEEGGSGEYRLQTFRSEVCARASWTHCSIVLGENANSKTCVSTRLAGQDAKASLLGLAYLAGQAKRDYLSYLTHSSPESFSNQLCRSVLSDRSVHSFTGKIKVERDAQRIESDQLNQNLILDDGATANGLPQLEILADDVKCSHGCTIGGLNADELFYLQTRGLSKSKAYRTLCRAFGYELIKSFQHNILKTKAYDAVQRLFNSETWTGRKLQ